MPFSGQSLFYCKFFGCGNGESWWCLRVRRVSGAGGKNDVLLTLEPAAVTGDVAVRFDNVERTAWRSQTGDSGCIRKKIFTREICDKAAGVMVGEGGRSGAGMGVYMNNSQAREDLLYDG